MGIPSNLIPSFKDYTYKFPFRDFQAQLSNISPAFNIAGLLPKVSFTFFKIAFCFLKDL